jgi:sugar lactone lactonase YvrE
MLPFSYKADLLWFTLLLVTTPCRTSDETWDAMDSVFVTLAKGAPAGMLCAYYPHNRSTHALMTGMWFANGVVLSPDESYVLVSDSLQANIHR